MTVTLDPRTLEARHGTGVYAKRPLTLVRGQEATLWDDAGRAYLDCASGQGVANVGHSHPRVVAAVQTQAATLVTCQEAVHNDVRAVYLSELAGVLPAGLDRIFLCNSGAEAVEAAIKFARASTGRPGVVAAMRGFHGRTLGALSATWEAHYREPFAPLVPEFGHVPYGNLAALEAAITDTTAAVLLEVVQGEGGVRPASEEFLRGAQRLCRERGALLLTDEVQTGFGRTGRMFACEHTGLEPDLLILGKAIAGGVPMGAVALGPRVAQMTPGTHGSTFGGNPLACAAARAVLDILREENLPAEAARKGEWLIDRLRALPHRRIREVRGRGLMVGLELRDRVAPHLAALQERGVLALPAGPSVLRLLPPLVISDAELEQVVQAVDEVLA
ncbi:aspartate aminotransferase family protein [Deinococcus sp. SDU3-2]|uniref:[LysW]-aminoadipate semialdehyde transaminase n=1 Tax=Deinococcus terrestris TaxID=2651870 RepID=A0A7X1NV99_9DEIO|nr:aspartate aminotransferase family protein [Deinococcus terrestris]MPY66436.1 aspartate aminotransferase family protein [Deinococcus terrestris]